VSAECLFFYIHDCDSVTHEEYKVCFFDFVFNFAGRGALSASSDFFLFLKRYMFFLYMRNVTELCMSGIRSARAILFSPI